MKELMAKTATSKAQVSRPAATEGDQSSSGDTSLQRVKNDYQQFFTYVATYRLKWEQYWKLWNNVRVKRQYEGDNDSFEPMTFQMVESIVDNVYGSRPKLTFLPTCKDQETDTKVLNGLWDYSWDKSSMDDKLPTWGRETTVVGNGMLFPSWDDGYMAIKHVPIRDCIFDITQAHPRDFQYAGYRRLAMIDNLRKAKRFDASAGEKDANGSPKGQWVNRYSNLDNIAGAGAGASGDPVDKELKEQIYAGTTLTGDALKNQVEVIYMCYKDKIIEVANRSTVIFEGPNPYFKASSKATVQLRSEQGEPMYDETDLPEGAEFMTQDELAQNLKPAQIEIDIPAIEPFIPVVMARGYIDPALVIAKGDVETIADTQEDLNDSVNMKKDNIVYSVQNIGVIDALSQDAIPQLSIAKPGSIVPIKNLSNFPNTFKWLEKPNFTTAATEEIARAKQSMRDTARVSEIAQGLIPPTVRTAQEANILINQAQQGFAKKVKSLEAGPYKDLGEIFVKFVQIFLTEEQLVRVVGKEGVEFKNFVPGKYWGPYDVKVVLEDEAKAQQKQDADQALETFQLLRGDPDVNQIELKKIVLTKTLGMDEDDLELLLTPDPNNQATMGGAPTGDVAAGTPPVAAPGGAPAPTPALTPSMGPVHA